MTDQAEDHGLSALDRAFGMRLAGDGDGALRLAASILVHNPADLGAALLVARLLLDAERVEPAGKLAERLVDALQRRGDLPRAVVAANLGIEAGGYTDGALQSLGAAFGAGTARLSDASPHPPAFPAKVEVAPHFQALSGAPLLDAAEKAAAHFLQQPDPVAAGGPVPRLPLFSELAPAALGRLLGAMQVRELPAGAEIIAQGDEGREAFVLVRGVANVVRHSPDGSHVLLAALGPGAIFGEMALLAEAPRAAAVLAVEPVVLLVIERAHLEGLSHQDPTIGRALGTFCQRRMVDNLMRHSRIFSALTDAARSEVMAHFTARSFGPGEKLLREGEETGALYLLASGTVSVRSTDADGDRVQLAELGPGDVVGEISLVLRKPATADVKAQVPTVALELTHDAFREATRAHPELLRELYDLATAREDETRSVVAQQALDVSDVVLL